MANKAILTALIMTMTLLSGCAGDSEEDDFEDVEMEGPAWVNDTGSETMWSISLESTEWLEVKSAIQMLERQVDGETYKTQMGMVVIHDDNWYISNGGGYSPIFGGNYTTCYTYNGGICYPSDPDGTWTITEWTVIYRIHEV